MPNSNNSVAGSAPVAVVLGGTNAHAALIEHLKNRNYHTVLVDYLENPPARRVADVHVRASTLDQDRVFEIARSVRADLVISGCVDQANVIACYVGERLGLPVPYSYDTALKIGNKATMKAVMRQNGIPTTRFFVVQSTEELGKVELTYPVVVKPADANGSKGVKRISQPGDLKNAVSEALGLSRNKKAIIEEFADGVNVDAIFLLLEHDVQLLMLRQRFGIAASRSTIMQYSHSLIPAGVSTAATSSIVAIARKIASAFGLRNTPLQIQAVAAGDSVNVLEFAARVGGGLSYRTVRLHAGIDLLDAVVDSYLGKKLGCGIKKANGVLSENNIYTMGHEFGFIKGLDAIVENGVAIEGFCYKTRGDQVGSELVTKNRVGAFIVKADDADALLKKVELARDMLEVYDISGNPVMRRDLYETCWERVRA